MVSDMKKIAAFITSFALLANISAVNAAAGYEPAAAASLLAEHGYEQYKDTFYYVSNSSGGKMFDVIECYDFNYNNLEVDLIDWSEWDNVYEEYLAELDFDATDDGIYLYDRIDEGDDPMNPASVSDKYRQCKEVCKLMCKDGVINAASYHSTSVFYQKYQVRNLLKVRYSEGEDKLAEILAEYSSDVSIDDLSDGVYDVSFNDVTEFERFIQIKDSLNTDYSITSTYNIMDSSLSVTFFSTEPTNLLTAIQEEESCDTNQSGAVDLDDAVQVLTHYANTAAGIAPAAETADMDVNGDGSVTLDDAVKVLTVYAELAAGLR